MKKKPNQAKVKLLLILICTILCNMLQAQTLQNMQNKDTLFHIYKLQKNQLAYICKQQTLPDTSWLLSNPYKKLRVDFNSSLDSVQAGTYLQATIAENFVTYTLVQKLPYSLTTKKIGTDVIIYLKNAESKNGKLNAIINNAILYYKNVQLLYDSGYGGYVTNTDLLAKKSTDNQLHIQYADADYVQLITFTAQPVYKNKYKKPRPSNQATGYFITDKPIYKLQDSLHYKAYMVDNETGKPITKPATLVLADANTGKHILTTTLNNITEGAYVWNYKLPDTLLQDRNYNISIYYKNNYKQNIQHILTVRVEDYLLNKNTISITPTKTAYRAGQNIVWDIKTTDANGFALSDVHVQAVVKLSNIISIDKDTLLLTQQMQDEFIKIDTVLPYNKLQQYIIDFKKLPRAKMNLTVIGTATDAQFEKTPFQFTVSYDPYGYQTICTQQGDSLQLGYLYNAQEANKKLLLKCYNAQQQLVDSVQITTPFIYKLKNTITSVVLYDGKTVLASQTIFFNALQIMHVQGSRQARSSTISFAYPFGADVHYKIKKANTIVASGCSNIINYTTTDSTLDEYSILLSNNMTGQLESNCYLFTFMPLHKKVNICCTLPTEAYPGQSLPIQFTATDWYGKPIANFNIASYAVSSMFANSLSEPYIYVPEAYKLDSKMEVINSAPLALTISNIFYTYRYFVTKRHIVDFNLHKNQYYQVLYPKQGMQIIKNKKQQPTAEIAVAVINKGVAYTPKYFLIDDNITAIAKINSPNRYSFYCDTGVHTISVRANDRMITIKNVVIQAHNKYVIAINMDSIANNIYPSNVTISDTMSFMNPTVAEQNMLEKSLLIVHQLGIDSILQISNNGKNVQQLTYYTNSFENVQIDNDYFTVIGPIAKPVDVMLKNKNNNFALQTGRWIHYYNYTTKEFTSKQMDAKSKIQFVFREMNFSYINLAYLLQPDTIATTIAVQVPEKTVMVNHLADKKLFNPNLYNYQSPNYDNTYCQIKLMPSQKNKITNCWILDANAKQNSSFHCNLYGGSAMVSYTANTPVDIYLFTPNQQVCLLKNINMPSFSTLFINADSLHLDTLTEQVVAKGIAMYNSITQIPYLPFYYKPSETNDLTIDKTSIPNAVNNAYISGTIVNENLQALPNAIVLMEQNGRYKFGAITNSKGMFEVLQMPAGMYDIKIIHSSSQLKYYYQVAIGGANTQYITAMLQPRQGQVPNFESITNSYRFSAFVQTKNSSLLVNVYDADSRKEIKNCTIQFVQPDSTAKNLVADKLFAYKNKEKSYTLIVKKEGYKTIEIRDIHILEENKTVLEIFMHASTKLGSNTELFSMDMEERRRQFEVELPWVGVSEKSLEKHIDYNSSGASSNYSYSPVIERQATTSTVKIVSKKSGAYQRKALQIESTSGISIGGGRAENTTYLIDGQMVRGESKDEAESTEEEYAAEKPSANDDGLNPFRGNVFTAKQDAEKQNNLFNKIINAGVGNQIRKSFSDVAYWLPNMVTDAQGKTFGTITLPDNITQWQSYTIGMGKGFAYGSASQLLKVYKPMQTITYTPSFLRNGDSIICKARFTNQLGSTKKVDLFFSINNKEQKRYSKDLEEFTTDSIAVLVNKNDSMLTLVAGLQYADKYTDAEQINIPIKDNAITLYNTQQVFAERDTAFTLQFKQGATGQVIFNNDIYEHILQYIKDLDNYQYGCVEQSSSKLKALLYQEQIFRMLGRKFNEQKQITRCISKIEDMQNRNGSWGWWRKGEADLYMTTYALDALMLASKYGYLVTAQNEAAAYLQKQIAKNNTVQKLYPLYILHKNNFSEVNAGLLKNISEVGMQITDKMYYYKLQQLAGQTVAPNDWYSLFLEMQNTCRMPYYDNFFYEPRAAVFTAYSLFAGTSLETDFAQQFLQQIKNGQLATNLNTFSKAAMIEALLLNAKKNNTPVVAEIKINDSAAVKTFPFAKLITTTSMQIAHKGAPVWVNTAEAYRIENPPVHDSIFSINTSLLQNNKASTKLQRGVTTQLKIDIYAYKTKQYVMIEVPLPAGLIVKNKPALFGGDYIEYKADKIIIYKTNVALGNNNFTIDVQPIYSGLYNMPPAKIEMMYYPFVYSNNLQTKIGIE